MKFTKHAYAKIWQNHPEDEHENTTITPLDHEDTNKPNNTPITLPYLPEYHTSANSMEKPDILEHCLTPESSDLIGFAKTHRNTLSKTGDLWTPTKLTTTNPKPADDTPPTPYHPRHGTSTRPNTTSRRTNKQPENNTEHHRQTPETHKNNPNPLLYHNHDQHFKHINQNQPAYKHQNNRADTPRTPKPKTETQPTLDLTETNQ